MAVSPRRLAQHGGAADVGLDEGERVHQRAVDVRLSGEVDDRVNMAGQRVDEVGIADIAMDETKTWSAFELGEVREVAGVGQLVEHRDLHFGPGAPEVADEVRADEARGARDQQTPQRTGHLIEGPAVQSYPMDGSSCGMRPSSAGA